jgi:hypothetical protein
MPIPAPKWVLAYYLTPIVCGAMHHMTWDWHAGIVLSSVVQPAFAAVVHHQFFENKQKL